MEMNGLAPNDVHAIRIARIPTSVEIRFNKQNQRGRPQWPWYVYGKAFFEALGAEFRVIDSKDEMLLQEIVYCVEEYIPCGIIKERSVGKKAIAELTNLSDQEGLEFDLDIWKEPRIHTILGICVARCQQIEYFISEAFLLGISKQQKVKYRTINELRASWERNTFGNMLKSIEEAYEIQPLVRTSFHLFLKMRNRLIHNLTTCEQYDIETHWGRLELLAFLSFFDVHSQLVRKAFKAAYDASIRFAVENFDIEKKADITDLFGSNYVDHGPLFFEIFTPKYEFK